VYLEGDDHYVADVYGRVRATGIRSGCYLTWKETIHTTPITMPGAGIHLSSAALIDWSGNDTYKAGHICQGAAHDYAVGMLIDRAGDDSIPATRLPKARRSTTRSPCCWIIRG